MLVTFKLFASLGVYLPNGAAKNSILLEVPDGTTVRKLLDDHRVPANACQVVLVNGSLQPMADWTSAPLKTGDAVAAWPAVGGRRLISEDFKS